MQSEEQREKIMKRNKWRFREMWGSIERTTYIQEEYQRSVDKEGSRQNI